jgi:hypothetical protein
LTAFNAQTRKRAARAPVKGFSPQRTADGRYGSWRVAGGTAQPLVPVLEPNQPVVQKTAGAVAFIETPDQLQGVRVMGKSDVQGEYQGDKFVPNKAGTVTLAPNP